MARMSRVEHLAIRITSPNAGYDPFPSSTPIVIDEPGFHGRRIEPLRHRGSRVVFDDKSHSFKRSAEGASVLARAVGEAHSRYTGVPLRHSHGAAGRERAIIEMIERLTGRDLTLRKAGRPLKRAS